ncbi:MAG: PHP domain-containing protein [Elusimicrobia bacterium]|nr:PHP domain-containing protein [Candidatus Liberimonas magnetica]
MKRVLALLFILLLLAEVLNAGMQRVSCIIHLHSSFSYDKFLSLAEIAGELHNKNIDVLMLTDHASVHLEYGLWPFENLLKRTYSDNSVIKAGPEKYFLEIKKAEIDNPGLMIIPGVEANVFYYWTGNPFRGKLTLNDWNKHMLIIGLEKPSDYYSLPILANPHYKKFNAILLWPVILIFVGFVLGYKNIFSLFIIVTGMLFLLINYPFTSAEFNQYYGHKGEKPYQNLINYANQKGALTYWAHPEAPNYDNPQNLGPVNAITKKYPESILNTLDYTGFAIYAEGYRAVGQPGGFWDQALLEYCSGKRAKPVWAIGERDYSTDKTILAALFNELWVKDKTKESVMESLKNGNCYTVWKTPDWGLTLDDFYVSNGKDTAVCGQEIQYLGPPRISLSVGSTDNKEHKLSIKLIKNGEILRVFEGATPLKIIYDDTSNFDAGKSYYRLVVEGQTNCHIALNPVFVKK